jgi:hypothetical protein
MEKLSNLRRTLAATMLTVLVAAPASARDFPLEWHWVRVTPSSTHKAWGVQQSAKAEVTFTHGGFIAKLYDDADPVAGDQPDIILQGHIDGRHASAVETLPDTDDGQRSLHGTIARTRTTQKKPSSGWGEDRISLMAGAEFIGISRMVRSGAAPGQ